jgi:hypothetical protein
VFVNRVLCRIFGPKREEVVEGWRRLHNENLHNLCASPNITGMIKSRRIRWSVHVACMGEMRNAYSISVEKPERKRPLGRPRHKWEENMKWILENRVGDYGLDSSGLG